MKSFYVKYFNAVSGPRYYNPAKLFTSYFLTFEDGCRLELMHREDISKMQDQDCFGWAHLAFSVGSKSRVDKLTDLMESDGYQVVGKPRTTGDGYYESIVLDPEKNQLKSPYKEAK